MMTFTPTIGMSQERFLTRFQQDQVDRAFWDELKHKSSNPHRLDRTNDAQYYQRAEELKKKNSRQKQKGEPSDEDLLNLGAEMKGMVGVRPNPKLIEHQQYHERWKQLSEQVVKPQAEPDLDSPLSAKATKNLQRLRDDDTEWFARNSADLAAGLGSFSTIAGTVGLVTAAASFAAGMTVVGAPAAITLGTAATALGMTSIAAKLLQGTVVALDPNTAEGSSLPHFKDAALDGALFGAGKGVKKVLGGAKDLASVERMQGLAFLKDWRGMTLQVLQKIDKMIQFLGTKFDKMRLQRVFGPSGLLQGSAEIKERALKNIRQIEIVQDVLELTKDGLEYGEHLVKIFLGVVSHVREGIGEGIEEVGEFIEGTGIRITDALRDAAHQLIDFGFAGPEVLARWGVSEGTRILSAGQRAVIGGARRVASGARTGIRSAVQAANRFIVRFAHGVSQEVIDILVRARLISQRVLATGETIFECFTETAYNSVNRILAFLHPTAVYTGEQIQHLMGLISATFGGATILGMQLAQLIVTRAARMFGPAAGAVGGLFRRVYTAVGGGLRTAFDMVLQLVQRGREFGEGTLTPAIGFFGGLIGRIGRRIYDFVSGQLGHLVPVVGLVADMIRNRASQGQDLLARLTEKGGSGLLAMLQTGVQRGFMLLTGLRGVGHTAVDAATGLGMSAVNRGAGLAQGLISRGIGVVGSIVERVTGFLTDRLGLGTRTAHGAVSLAERILTRPVSLIAGHLPPFAVPLANRYLAGAGRIGAVIHGLVDRAGTGAAGAVGWTGRLLTGMANAAGSVGRAGVGMLANRAMAFGMRTSAMAHRTVDRVSGNAMGFMSRMVNRVRSMIQGGATLAANLIRSPIGTAHTGVQAGIQAVSTMTTRTAAFTQGLVDRGASMLGASASNPVVAGAHAVVGFAEQAAARATNVVAGVTDSLFGWLQREGTGSEPAVANPVGLAQSLKQKERPVHLPPRVREMLASQLGFDPSMARIHAGAESGRAASSLKAEAFTIGSDIFFNPGQYDPHSTRGQSLLAHELTHVVQQSQGRSSTQQFRDSGGDAMELEAQEQGRAMALAVRDRRLGGIDAHEVELRRADGAVVSDEDQNRLARIQELTEAKVITKAANAGITRLISATVNVDVILDLDRMSDDEAAELWSQQIVASVQTTAEPTRSPRSTLQRSVQSDLNASAQARLGVAPGMPAPSDIDLNRRRTQQYADMYLTNPAVFKWAGLAAFASRLVGQGIAGSQIGHAAAPGLMATGTGPGMAAGAALAANPLDRALLQGNRLIYDNIFWMHMAYQQGGIERIRQAHAEGSVPDDMLAAWELIQEGRDTNDDTKIWQGNRGFARYEQQVIVQPVYDQHPMLFGALSAGMVSPAPGMEPGMRMPYDGEFLQQASPGANIGNSQDRWNWVDNQMLPQWQALETQQPERIRYLVQELRESGGLVNTFEDSDIREGVATRSAEDLAGVAGTERVRMVNRLLSGWIADEDVDAAVRLLESIQSEEELDQVAGGIAESMDGMWSSRQRARLQLALARARAKPKTPAQAPAQPRLSNNPRRQNVSPSRHSNRQPRTNRRGHRNPAQPEPASRTEPNEQQRSPVQRESRSNVDAVRAAQIAELAHAQRLAEFADDTYQGSGAPSGSTRLDGDPAELQAMGLTPGDFHDPDSGFDAAVYREAGTGRIIIAYRGTEADSIRDWRTNAGQGVGMDMEQYRRAATLARAIRRAYPEAPMEITGHSLGGGLATLASAATGIPATTFNAANVHPDTYGYSGADPSRVPVGSTNYTVDGEPLTAFQGYAPTIGTGLGGVALSPFGPGGVIGGGLLGRRMGEGVSHSPLRHVTMEARNADGSEMGTFEHSAGHGMAGVRGALEHRRAELESHTRGAEGSW